MGKKAKLRASVNSLLPKSDRTDSGIGANSTKKRRKMKPPRNPIKRGNGHR